MNWGSCLLILMLSLSSYGQPAYNSIEGKFKTGFLIGHRSVMGHLPKSHAFAGELSFVRRAEGFRPWHSHYNYPEYGVTLFGGTVGNNEILGTYWATYGFINFGMIQKKIFQLRGKLGAGLAFGTKQYDEVTNPKNVAMSSPITAIICIGLDARFEFDRDYVSVGMDMTHFSNGAFKVPNLGLNLPFLSLGYGHKIPQTKRYKMDLNALAFKTPQRKLLYGITGVLSAKEVFPTSGKKYPVFGLSGNARIFLNPRVGWEMSADLISKQAVLDYRPEIEKSQLDILQFGVYGGYMLPLDRFHFVLGMGVYVRDKYRPEDPVYHRVGVRYFLNNGIILNCALKSHWARADYVEWGIGYTFNYKRIIVE